MPESLVIEFVKDAAQVKRQPPPPPSWKVNVRLPLPVLEDLDYVAQTLGMTRTSCAEDMLIAAIRDSKHFLAENPELIPDVIAQLDKEAEQAYEAEQARSA